MRPAVALFTILAACRPEELPPPRPLPLPVPDTRPALLTTGPLSPRLANYTIEASLDTDEKKLTATATLRWKHDGNAPVTELPFHLYMNAFKSESTVFMRESHGHHRRAKRKSGSWGQIDVSSIRLADGTELRPGARYGEDETTLLVPLPHPVAPGEELTLSFTFTTQLPAVFARTGYSGEFFMVGQWFPKIGVLRVEPAGQRWHCETFHLNNEFFADFGVYDVTLDIPDTHAVAASGVLTAAAAPAPGRHRLTWHAEDVHDFAFMANPYMKTLETTAHGSLGDIQVRILYRPGHEAYAPRHLETARLSIETYDRLFGAYPWTRMTVINPPVDAEASAGGMEYPTLVTSGGDYPVSGLRLAEEVTAHEIAHNWFQGLIASDEVEDPFLDEGLTQYATGLVLDAQFGADRSLVATPFVSAGYYPAHGLIFDDDVLRTPVATRAYDFPSFEAYGQVVYYKTALILKTLENVVGRERFLGALGAYARAWRFRHPAREDFFAALSAGLHDERGGDWRWFLDPAFNRGGGARYEIGKVTLDDAPGDQVRSEAKLTSTGAIPAPVEVDFEFADGTRETVTWEPRGERESRVFSFVRDTELVAIDVNPRRKVLIALDPLHQGLLLDGEAGPSWRAGARAGFWLQTLEQLVGL